MKTVQSEVSNNSTQDINIVDFVKRILSYWVWFLLAMIIFGTIFGIRTTFQPYVYTSEVTLFMNDPNQKTSVDLELYGLSNRKKTISMSKEKLMFQSLSTLKSTVINSKVNVSYKYKKDFRDIELFTSAPFEVIPSKYDYFLTFYLKKVPENDAILISSTRDGKYKKVNFGSNLSIENKEFTIKTKENVSWPSDIIKVTIMSADMLKYAYQAKIKFRQDDKNIAILNLSIEDDNKNKCTTFLNELVAEYNKKSLKIHNTVSINTGTFIEKRLNVINKQLNDLENKMQSFIIENNGVDYTTTSKNLLDKINKYNEETIETNTNISLLEYIKDFVLDKANKKNYIPLNVGVQNQSLIKLIQKYNDLKLNRYQLTSPEAGGGVDNPIIKDIDNNINITSKNIVVLVDNIISSLKFNLSKIDKYVASVNKEMEGIPSKEKDYLTLKRLHDIKEGLYVNLLNKMEENALSQAVQVDNATIVDIGDGPSSYIAPNMIRSIILGFIVGFIIVSFIILVTNFFDTKVHSTQDIERFVDAPILGTVPFDKDKSLVNISDNDPRSESFRLIRSNLYFMNKKNVCNRIIVNSINENSGKTYNASNLARTIAFSGQKTLLIDMDIRKGTLSRLFKLNNCEGLTNYLIDDEIKKDDIIQKDTNVKNLHIIPCGDKAPNPTELLMDEKLDKLIEELSSVYSYIIMDNVPIDAVSDPFIVNRLANITLFIIRAGKLEKNSLKFIAKLKEENKLNNMAIILNGIKKKHQSYRNYSYSYTYGSEDKKSFFKRLFNR